MAGYGATGTVEVKVVAPANLSAGYDFDAVHEGTTFTVTVPEGGVAKGQIFAVPCAAPAVAVAVTSDGGTVKPGSSGIPRGGWRDGLFDCWKHGFFHAHFWMAWCCLPFFLGQLLTRMKMLWSGRRAVGDDGRWRNTFRNVAAATICYSIIVRVGLTQPSFSLQCLQATFGVYVIYVMAQLRATLRHVYSIPEENCLGLYRIVGSEPRDGLACRGSDGNFNFCTAGVPVGWEDVCCAIWCQLCVAGQMARHTVSYEERKAVCCNSTGVQDWDDDEAYEGVETAVGEGSVLVV